MVYIFKKLFCQKLQKIKQKDFRLAKMVEEAIGIEGYIDKVPNSIKPDTYKTMSRLSESIEVKIIYYIKTKSGIEIEFD